MQRRESGYNSIQFLRRLKFLKFLILSQYVQINDIAIFIQYNNKCRQQYINSVSKEIIMKITNELIEWMDGYGKYFISKSC